MLLDLHQESGLENEPQGALRAVAEAGFRVADVHGRGIVNFGQAMLWFSTCAASGMRSRLTQ